VIITRLLDRTSFEGSTLKLLDKEKKKKTPRTFGVFDEPHVGEVAFGPGVGKLPGNYLPGREDPA